MYRTAIALTCLATIACAQPAAPPAAEFELDAAAILADVRALSADDMDGRATGTAGKQRAADFIEQRFRDAGLEPVDGTYRQPVQLVGMRRNDDTASLSIAGAAGALDLADAGNVAYWSTAQQPAVDITDAPLVFVGYGVEAPEYGWDDFKGEDVTGKVLLFLNDDPPVTEDGVEIFGGAARTYYGRWTYKFEQAMKHGAAGAFMVHTTPSASYPFSVIQGSGQRENFALDLPGAGYQVDLLGWLDENLSDTIAQALDTDLEGLFEMARQRDFRPLDTGYRVSAHLDTEVRRIATQNVIGILPGSDAELGAEVVVFSAHYDHLGSNPALEGDTVFNGAWDNASGAASIIALAEAFAGLPSAPRRSLLFLACAAEESGSLGSAWFVAQPPFARDRLVANFNIDMPQIFGPTADIAAIGVDTSSLGDILLEVAGDVVVTVDGASRPLLVTGDPNPSAGSFYRSDQVNFAKAGIPALYLNPGNQHLDDLGFDPSAYREAHYHQVSDEVREEWNLAGLVRDLSIFFETALRVANADDMPRWKAGNEFEQEWEDLHGVQ